MIWSPEFRQRVLFNASKAYARQVKTGEEYELLQPVYSTDAIIKTTGLTVEEMDAL